MRSIFHYTSFESFIGMIKDTSFSNNLNFWASQISSMNDPLDGFVGDIAIERHLQDIENELNIPKNERIYNTIKSDIIFKDIRRILLEDKNATNNYLYNHFVISFSEEKDIIPLVSMYCDKGKGVILGFDRNKFVMSKNLIRGNVSYDENNLKDLLKECYIKNLMFSHFHHTYKNKLNPILIRTLSFYSQIISNFSFTKINKYEYEKEYRITIYNETSNVQERDVYVNETDKRTIPYIEYKIPISYLNEIILGPNVNKVKFIEIKELLEAKKFPESLINTIKISDVPFR